MSFQNSSTHRYPAGISSYPSLRGSWHNIWKSQVERTLFCFKLQNIATKQIFACNVTFKYSILPQVSSINNIKKPMLSKFPVLMQPPFSPKVKNVPISWGGLHDCFHIAICNINPNGGCILLYSNNFPFLFLHFCFFLMQPWREYALSANGLHGCQRVVV